MERPMFRLRILATMIVASCVLATPLSAVPPRTSSGS